MHLMRALSCALLQNMCNIIIDIFFVVYCKVLFFGDPPGAPLLHTHTPLCLASLSGPGEGHAAKHPEQVPCSLLS